MGNTGRNITPEGAGIIGIVYLAPSPEKMSPTNILRSWVSLWRVYPCTGEVRVPNWNIIAPSIIWKPSSDHHLFHFYLCTKKRALSFLLPPPFMMRPTEEASKYIMSELFTIRGQRMLTFNQPGHFNTREIHKS